MVRKLTLSGFATLLLTQCLSAQQPTTANRQDALGPLGVRLTAIPQALYAQMPQLPRNQGVLVDAVEEDSQAWRGGLRRHDIVLSVGANAVSDGKGLSQKLVELKRGNSLSMTILRGGRELVLTYSPEGGSAEYSPKAYIKPGGPPAVSVQVQPLENDRLSLVIHYYSDQSSKLQRFSCTGQLDEIESRVQTEAREQRIPERVWDLVQVALRRIRALSPMPKQQP